MPRFAFLLRVIFFSATLHFSLAHARSSNPRPIVGVLTQPAFTDLQKYGAQYINADYVKWLEQGGARVVALRYDLPEEQLFQMFTQLNGLIFPGGGTSLNISDSAYYRAAKKLFHWGLAANDNNDYFPMWGTCLGFEFLGVAVNNDDLANTLINFESENISLPLTFTPAAESSRLFSLQSNYTRAATLQYLSTHAATDNMHMWGISPQTFADSAPLSNFFRVLATSVDRQNKEFIALWEARHYPVYASQFHPERSLFEYTLTEDIDHSFRTLEAMRYFGAFFVEEAKKSKHRFPSLADELNALVYNTQPLFGAKTLGSDEDLQYYPFPASSAIGQK